MCLSQQGRVGCARQDLSVFHSQHPSAKPKVATVMMHRRKEVMVYHVVQTSLHTAWGTEMPMCLFGSHLHPSRAGGLKGALQESGSGPAHTKGTAVPLV